VAVAVSGGRDSLALALLAADWARARGGQITALTVDHGLRRESAAEARQVGRWMRRAGLGHAILKWRGAKPASGVQDAARRARYRLLEEWCRQAGVLHLLLGHQRDDQSETVAMRQARGSGAFGLSGMAAVVETASVRRLRPLLGFSRARLAATLAARGQDWIDDPANRDPRFARAHLRRGPALDTAALVGRAARHGRARAAAEQALAAFLARCVRLAPEGYAAVDRALLAAAPQALAARALGAVIATVSGADYAPARAALARLVGAARRKDFAGATLGDCRMVPDGAAHLLVLREGRPDKPDPTPALFRIAGRIPPGLTLRRLGAEDARRLLPRDHAVPAAARASLPALWRRHEAVIVPQFGAKSGPETRRGKRGRRIEIAGEFRPRRPLARAPFAPLPGTIGATKRPLFNDG
jgi:tRNA(Ile)-lysidine synthase